MRLLILIAALAMSGCASLQSAGVAEYSVRPVVVGLQIVCCEVMVRNGKEIALVKAHIEKSGDNYTVDLEERGVVAFQGQSIAAGAAKASIDGVATLGAAAIATPALGAGIRAIWP